ncbi:DUF2787 family protein [Vibrio coralliilyticus]|nr:DUF2787 family protein [Vibrio coralliilyticus]
MLTLKQNLPFYIPEIFNTFVSERVTRDGISVINFRDSSYDHVSGGFRPVEIKVEKLGKHYALISTTEFAYLGQESLPKLSKYQHFDFINNTYSSKSGDLPIDLEAGASLQSLIESTLTFALFDEVKVSFVGGHVFLTKDTSEA